MNMFVMISHIYLFLKYRYFFVLVGIWWKYALNNSESGKGWFSLLTLSISFFYYYFIKKNGHDF